MFLRGVTSGRGKIAAICTVLTLAATVLASTSAEARRRHYRHKVHSGVSQYQPAFAAIVVDANSGKTLYAQNENELRHPASITKVMTLYLLFEQLEKGKLALDSEIRISGHAHSQAPSKLGLDVGETIAVEDAIKAIVTKSANDIAVAVAEAVGGDEEHFADLMTRKARALGMSRTVYVNASGLPDNQQVTTARDLTVLGRAIQEHFPKYYHYFSTHNFNYAGASMRNHNHLLGRVEGMDGIKTGYTRASGFNLLTSVKRDGHRIVSVVLGGKSGGIRDRIMAGLIEDHIDNGATTRTTAMIARGPDGGGETIVADAQPVRTAPPVPVERIRVEEVAKAIAAKPAPAGAPLQLAAVNPQIDRIRPAYVAAAPKPQPIEATPSAPAVIAENRIRLMQGTTSARPVVTGKPVVQMAAATTPSALGWVASPPSRPLPDGGAKAIDAAAPPAARPVARPADIASKPLPAKTTTVVAKADDGSKSASSHPGWMIQIGATDDAGKAGELLARAKLQSNNTLASARPFTEKVQKGDAVLYRARFAGLEPDTAEAACKSLKKSGFACFTTKN